MQTKKNNNLRWGGEKHAQEGVANGQIAPVPDPDNKDQTLWVMKEWKFSKMKDVARTRLDRGSELCCVYVINTSLVAANFK